jgi:excisionase family DNA binding protein
VYQTEALDYLSVSDFAARLGVSPRTVHKLLARGEIRGAIRFGKVIRIPVATLHELPPYQPVTENR